MNCFVTRAENYHEPLGDSDTKQAVSTTATAAAATATTTTAATTAATAATALATTPTAATAADQSPQAAQEKTFLSQLVGAFRYAKDHPDIVCLTLTKVRQIIAVVSVTLPLVDMGHLFYFLD